MAQRYCATDYLYASARIRAMENSLIGQDKLNALMELSRADEIVSELATQGFVGASRTGGSADAEPMLLAALKKGIAAVKESVPYQNVTVAVEYPNDCHNIKSYLKCAVRGTDPATLLIDAGSLPAEELLAAMRAEDYTALPPHMAAAIPAAREAFAKTADPREIDFILDRAVFADMKAALSGLPLAEEILAARADLINVSICLRLMRMENPYVAAALFAKSSLPCGTLDENFFAKAFEGGEDCLVAQLAATPYDGIVKKGIPAATLEKNIDNALMRIVRRAKYLPFGAEIPFAYLFGLDTSLKNLRILLAGKRAGLDAATVRERMRDSYV